VVEVAERLGVSSPEPERRRLDPFDPATARHLGGWEFNDVTDRAVFPVVLKIGDGADPSYSWVMCSANDCGWQVPLSAEESAG
jgi:hypothetical protein